MRVKPCLFLLCLVLSACSFSASDTPLDIVKLFPEAEAKVQAGDHEGAIAVYRRIVALNPMLGDAWSTLASELYTVKKHEESNAAYLKALDYGGILPDTILYNMACNYALMGKKTEALDYLERAMNKGFAQLNLVRTDEDLKSLHAEPKYKELAVIVDTSKMSRVEGWQFDIGLLARELKRVHSLPYKNMTPAEFDGEIKRIRDSVPSATDDQLMVDLAKFVVRVGDGHTFAAPGLVRTLPLRMYWFEEGVYVIGASPEHDDLLWAKVDKIGGVPVLDVLAKVEPLVSRDNPMNVKWQAQGRITTTTLLKALGITPTDDKATLSIVDRTGKTRDVEVNALPVQGTMHGNPNLAAWPKDFTGDKPLYRRNVEAPYWFEYLPGSKTMYLQYNSVRNDPKENTAAFTKRLFSEIEKADVDKLVVDIRWNNGGNTFLHRPLVRAIIQSKLNSPGHLFVITGRNTFSAAQNFANYVERSSDAVFVGEPTGSSPNFIGESNMLTLPYSKMICSISNRIWYGSNPLDARVWIAPRIYTPPTFADWRSGRDAALDAILGIK